MQEVNIIEGYKSIHDLAAQLITLGTAVIALSITFMKDVLKDAANKPTGLLKLSWFSYLLSICFGIWTMMTLTGMIFKVSTQGVASVQSQPYGSTVLPAFLQIVMFVAATVFMILYGAKALRANKQNLPNPTK